jgi:hypothetical protein
MVGLLASALVATNILAEAAIPADATASELVASCRTMIPADVEFSGRIVLRNRRGTVKAEHAYALARKGGATSLSVDGAPCERPADAGAPIMGTDVTWSDLTLDYLWWDDVSFDAERESETVHGQVCSVIVMKRGERLVRVWVDRKTGAMMQAEEMSGGKPLRRLWGTRIKKFGERWVPNVLEVETVGSGHRTKITVEEMK